MAEVNNDRMVIIAGTINFEGQDFITISHNCCTAHPEATNILKIKLIIIGQKHIKDNKIGKRTNDIYIYKRLLHNLLTLCFGKSKM